jgi:hypothetical protein
VVIFIYLCLIELSGWLMSITRREFFKVAGMLGAGAVLPAIAVGEESLDYRDLALEDLLFRYFDGNVRARDEGVEEINLDSTLKQVARRLQPRLFDDHVRTKNYFIASLPTGEIRSICYNNGLYTFDRAGKEEAFLDLKISTEIANMIRRLYNPESHIDGFLWDTDYDFPMVPISGSHFIEQLNAGLPHNLRHGNMVLLAAERNLRSAGQNADSFVRALRLLARVHYAEEKLAAGIWYVANMDSMGYRRSGTGGAISSFATDLQEMDASTFFENINYAVDARNRFNYGMSVSWDRFLEYVIPARSLAEPLQRWRRHAYKAIAPSLDKILSREKAISNLNELGAAIFRPNIIGWEQFSSALRYGTHVGNCQDENGLVQDLMRAGGLDVFSFSNGAWPNGYGNHLWSGYYPDTKDPDTEDVHSIMGCEPSDKDPRRYMGVRHAKVFRSNAFGNFDDVTVKFTSTLNIRLNIRMQSDGESYLAVLNNGKWVTVSKADIIDGTAVFNAVGNTGIVYMVTEKPVNHWSKMPIQQIGEPFFLDGNKSIPLYSGPQESNTSRIDVTSELVGQTLGNATYSIHTWHNHKWGEVARTTAVNGAIGLELYNNRIYQVFSGNSNALKAHGFPFMVLDSAVMPLRGEVAR